MSRRQPLWVILSHQYHSSCRRHQHKSIISFSACACSYMWLSKSCKAVHLSVSYVWHTTQMSATRQVCLEVCAEALCGGKQKPRCHDERAQHFERGALSEAAEWWVVIRLQFSTLRPSIWDQLSATIYLFVLIESFCWSPSVESHPGQAVHLQIWEKMSMQVHDNFIKVIIELHACARTYIHMSTYTHTVILYVYLSIIFIFVYMYRPLLLCRTSRLLGWSFTRRSWEIRLPPSLAAEVDRPFIIRLVKTFQTEPGAQICLLCLCFQFPLW